MNRNEKNIVSISEIMNKVGDCAHLGEDVIVFSAPLSGTSQNDWTDPLQFDSLCIILVTAGECRMNIDLREFKAERNSLIIFQPKNYVGFMRFSPDCRVEVLACSRYMMEEIVPSLSEILPLLIHHRIEPVTRLSEESARGMQHFYNFMRGKLLAPPTQFLRKKILCILQASLFELLDIHVANLEKRSEPRSRKDEIMARFIVSVSENFREQRQVSYYAEKLCITPKHLSAVVKDISGHTAGDWIENYVGMEAKVLLKSTDLTVQEIASRLNFSSQSFFGKYFKHLTGQSPTEYRRNFSLGK